jgi:mRNA-degrading endonuclease RelE of RelBE toxin-antitoxin system
VTHGPWSVDISNHVKKKIKKLPDTIIDALFLLISSLEYGPIQAHLKNYGMLSRQGEEYHCTLKMGRPRYVACWRVVDKKLKHIEVYYVGTHEDAPY